MPLDVMSAATRRIGREAAAVSFGTKMNDILHQLTDALNITQAATVETANRTRQPHDFQVGDSVFLNTRHWDTRRRRVTRLLRKKMGPD